MAYTFAASSGDNIDCGVVPMASTWSLAVRANIKTGYVGVLAALRSATQINFQLYIVNGDIVCEGTVGGAGGHDVTWTSGYSDGSMHVLVATYDGTTLSLYADSDTTPKATRNPAGTYDQPAGAKFCIGSDSVGSTFSWGQTVYEVGYWPNVVLTAIQAAAIMGSGQLPWSMPEPAHYWPLTSASNANDMFGTAHGTVSGATFASNVFPPWFPRGTRPTLWFGSAIGEPDMTTLFTTPSVWPLGRKKVSAFVLAAMNVRADSSSSYWGGNYYSVLNSAKVFQPFPVVAEIAFNAIDSTVADNVALLDRVVAAGGHPLACEVDWFLTNDGGWDHSPGMMATMAGEFKSYVDGVHASYPNVLIGDIEGFLFWSADEIVAWLDALIAVGCPVPFFALDVRWTEGHETECRTVAAACARRGIALHTFLNAGASGAESVPDDATYYAGAMGATTTILNAMPNLAVANLWSWYNVGDTPRITPTLLAESDAHSHTKLLLDVASALGILDVPQGTGGFMLVNVGA